MAASLARGEGWKRRRDRGGERERETTQILKHKWMTPHDSYGIYVFKMWELSFVFLRVRLGISFASISLFQYFSMDTLCKRKLKLPSPRKEILWDGPSLQTFKFPLRLVPRGENQSQSTMLFFPRVLTPLLLLNMFSLPRRFLQRG